VAACTDSAFGVENYHQANIRSSVFFDLFSHLFFSGGAWVMLPKATKKQVNNNYPVPINETSTMVESD
jgi:hypothetical protein